MTILLVDGNNVIGSVPDVRALVLTVEHWWPDGRRELL